jgi:hypothetical protein
MSALAEEVVLLFLPRFAMVTAVEPTECECNNDPFRGTVGAYILAMRAVASSLLVVLATLGTPACFSFNAFNKGLHQLSVIIV